MKMRGETQVKKYKRAYVKSKKKKETMLLAILRFLQPES